MKNDIFATIAQGILRDSEEKSVMMLYIEKERNQSNDYF